MSSPPLSSYCFGSCDSFGLLQQQHKTTTICISKNNVYDEINTHQQHTHTHTHDIGLNSFVSWIAKACRVPNCHADYVG